MTGDVLQHYKGLMANTQGCRLGFTGHGTVTPYPLDQLTIPYLLLQNIGLFPRTTLHMPRAHHPFQALPPCMTDAGLSRRRSVLFAFTFSPPHHA